MLNTRTHTQSPAVTLVQRHITTSRPSAEDRNKTSKADIKASSQSSKREFRNTDERYRKNTLKQFYF